MVLVPVVHVLNHPSRQKWGVSLPWNKEWRGHNQLQRPNSATPCPLLRPLQTSVSSGSREPRQPAEQGSTPSLTDLSAHPLHSGSSDASPGGGPQAVVQVTIFASDCRCCCWFMEPGLRPHPQMPPSPAGDLDKGLYCQTLQQRETGMGLQHK